MIGGGGFYCPDFPAASLDIGDRATGRDGNDWEVVFCANNKCGVKWKLLTSKKSAPKRVQEVSSKKKSAPTRVQEVSTSSSARKCPEEMARNLPVGTTRKGRDGQTYVVQKKINKYGDYSYSWLKIK